jgi:hypothetical protein
MLLDLVRQYRELIQAVEIERFRVVGTSSMVLPFRVRLRRVSELIPSRRRNSTGRVICPLGSARTSLVRDFSWVIGYHELWNF